MSSPEDARSGKVGSTAKAEPRSGVCGKAGPGMRLDR
jgi:hypothetical protein